MKHHELSEREFADMQSRLNRIEFLLEFLIGIFTDDDIKRLNAKMQYPIFRLKADVR